MKFGKALLLIVGLTAIIIGCGKSPRTDATIMDYTELSMDGYLIYQFDPPGPADVCYLVYNSGDLSCVNN